MMASKMILLNAHYYVQEHFCASDAWQKAEFATLNAQLYQKPGIIRVWADRVEVVLEPYRYAHLSQAAEEACALFNAASLKDEHGRRVTMQVRCVRTRVRQARWCADSDPSRVTFENGIFSACGWTSCFPIIAPNASFPQLLLE